MPIRTAIFTGGRYGRLKIAGATEARVMALWERVRPMEPETFARQALAAVVRNEAVIILPRWWSALWYLDRLAPSWSARLIRAAYAELRRDLDRP